MRLRYALLLVLYALTMVGCVIGRITFGPDGGNADMEGTDSGIHDAGVSDSGLATDSGMPDSGETGDSGEPFDAGQFDAGVPDSGPTDAGEPDAGPPSLSCTGVANCVQNLPTLSLAGVDQCEKEGTTSASNAFTPVLLCADNCAGQPDAGGCLQAEIAVGGMCSAQWATCQADGVNCAAILNCAQNLSVSLQSELTLSEVEGCIDTGSANAIALSEQYLQCQKTDCSPPPEGFINGECTAASSPCGPQYAACIAQDADGGSVDAGPVDAGPVDAGPVTGPVEVTTLAGNGHQNFADGTGGPNGTAEFNWPHGIAVDSQGNVYVGDLNNNRVRRVDPSGNVITLAGNGRPAYSDGTGGATGTATFDWTDAVAPDTHGNVYVADFNNNRIRMIDSSGNVTTVAGNGNAGYVDGSGGPDGAAEFSNPSGVAVDAQGNVYVGDQNNNCIRKIDTFGNVTTYAGTSTSGAEDGSGGPNGTARFSYPEGISLDAQGNLYVADFNNNRVRKVDTSGNVTTVAGNGGGYRDGTGGADGTAEFSGPGGVAVDLHGNVYVGDYGNMRVRKIDASGNVTTLAGNGQRGFADGTGGPNGTAQFWWPWGVAVDSHGIVYVGDYGNNRIRKITP